MVEQARCGRRVFCCSGIVARRTVINSSPVPAAAMLGCEIHTPWASDMCTSASGSSSCQGSSTSGRSAVLSLAVGRTRQCSPRAPRRHGPLDVRASGERDAGAGSGPPTFRLVESANSELMVKDSEMGLVASPASPSIWRSCSTLPHLRAAVLGEC